MANKKPGDKRQASKPPPSSGGNMKKAAAQAAAQKAITDARKPPVPPPPATPTPSATATPPSPATPETARRVPSPDIFGLPFWYDPKTGNYYDSQTSQTPIATSDASGQITWGSGNDDTLQSQRLANYYGGLASAIRQGTASFAPMPPNWGGDFGNPEIWTPDDPNDDGSGGGSGEGGGEGGGGPDGGGGGGPDGGGGSSAFDEDIFDTITSYLKDWGLGSLSGWVKQAMIDGWTESRIMRELRKRPEYEVAFPEQKARKDLELPQMSEAAIFAARGQYALVARRYGLAPSTKDTTDLIAGDVSASEWEHRLDVYQRVQEHGEGVRSVFQNILGISLTDQDLHEFFDAKIQTPELDKAFEDAYYRGLPALVNLGVRGQEEADMLRSLGINPETAFQGYQQVAGQLPIFSRLEAVNNAMEGKELPAPQDLLHGATTQELIAAFAYQDPNARQSLRRKLIAGAAQWQADGRPTSSGGALTGLTAP